MRTTENKSKSLLLKWKVNDNMTRRQFITDTVGFIGACIGNSIAVKDFDQKASPQRHKTDANERKEAQTMQPIKVGSGLQLLADESLIERLVGGCQLRLHHPVPREVAIVFDAPWEGNASACYVSVFQDEGLYRMFYRGLQYNVEPGRTSFPHPPFVCYAESDDGINWRKPRIGLIEFQGSKDNNIVWDGPGASEFAVFKDTNPSCPVDARYKMIVAANMRGKRGLWALKSPDGLRWSYLSDEPIITKGAFDSQNLAFWDEVHGKYRAYFRGFRDGYRDILTSTSEDFIHWTEPVWLEYPGAVREHLYTNVIKPYHRAPHLFVGFPTRYIDRGWSPSMEALPNLEHRRLRASASQRYGTALTEALFMVSQDGFVFRRWAEAFLRPGPEISENWKYGDNYIAWHIVETKSHIPEAPNELSFYASEGYWTGKSSWLRRYTLRIDGFVSAYSPMAGGEVITKPIVFEGKQLTINFSTSAAGSVWVEIQHPDGRAIEGFSIDDCFDIFGDSLERVVVWKKGSNVASLSGQVVRLRFILKDADLFAFRFC